MRQSHLKMLPDGSPTIYILIIIYVYNIYEDK